MAKLILVIGLTGAGKTSYCLELSTREKAWTVSIDRWMKALYWQEMPKEPDMQWFIENGEWYAERIERCEAFIREEIRALAKTHINIVLDLGFTSRDHRITYLKLAHELGLLPEIHFIDVPAPERWQRVEKRNKERGETYSMIVSRPMFDYIEEIFEPISQEEINLCSSYLQVRDF